MKITRDEKEIDDLIQKLSEARGTGTTSFPEFSYETGILYFFWWLTGDTDSHPLSEDHREHKEQ